MPEDEGKMRVIMRSPETVLRGKQRKVLDGGVKIEMAHQTLQRNVAQKYTPASVAQIRCRNESPM